MQAFRDVFINAYTSQKIALLAQVAHELTVHARFAWSDLKGEQCIEALKGFNELQHTISSQIGVYALNDEKRYPDEVLMDLLTEKAAHWALSESLEKSFQRTLTVIHERHK